MFHPRTLRIATTLLLVPSILAGPIGIVFMLVAGAIAFWLIDRFVPKPDWYENTKDGEGLTRLNLSGAKRAATESKERVRL